MPLHGATLVWCSRCAVICLRTPIASARLVSSCRWSRGRPARRGRISVSHDGLPEGRNAQGCGRCVTTGCSPLGLSVCVIWG